ncbi:substrate-binding periplasmic protein [Magnetococcus sp. PR-3]|uniref:substrate-binding periplasmic protein n=1 Tax=Magnetococcus sp. PR-3 TaxID=3120355 RepID=UPI002FCE2905
MRYISILLLLLTLSIGNINQPAYGEEKGPVILVANPWCPYNCRTQGDQQGYVVELARAAFAQYGRKLVYQHMPWERALLEADQGRVDGVIGAAQEEAPELIYPQSPIGMSSVSFVARRNHNWTYRNLEDLKGLVVGITPGFAYGDALDEYFAKTPEGVKKLFGTDPLKQGLRLILAKRLDVTLDDDAVLRYMLKKNRWEGQLQLAGHADDAVPLFIGFSPKGERGKQLAKELDAGIHLLRQQGKLEQILKKYALKDWAP